MSDSTAGIIDGVLSNTAYMGFDGEVQREVHDIARQFTNRSHLSPAHSFIEKGSEHEDSDGLSRVSTIAPGINPMNDVSSLDPRLDPNSDRFESRFWIKNFRALMDKDPDHYKNFSLGITYKNLTASGDATDADYQTNFINAPFKMVKGLAKNFLSSRASKPNSRFDILKSMDAVIKPGEVVVVLGRPGSGCTTLLKSIASNTHGFDISQDCEISYDGLTPSEVQNHFRGDIVYNAESDIHFPHLTVWETLTTAAKFRTPRNRIPGVSREAYAEALTEMYMATYGLSHTKNTKVGNDLVRGVSGGERKRVSIAEVSLAGASLQCWDNATRGLDSATALEFVKALRTSADVLDTTAVIAIYQCSQDAYDLFDKVSVLYSGHQIFFGRADRAKEYFLKMGWHCPQRQTTADFLTSVTSPRERVAQPGYENKVPKTAQEFEAYWKSSPEYAALMAEVEQSLDESSAQTSKAMIFEAKHSKQAKNVRKTSSYTVSFPMQVRYLLTREVQRIRNDIYFHAFSVIGNSLMSLVLCSIFYNLQNTTGSFYYRGAAMFMSVLFNSFASFLEIMSLFEARPIVEKHKQFALYHPSADALASVISQIPFKVATAIIFNLIYYFMVNFRRTPGRFFFYLLINLLATFTMSHFFRLIGSMCSTLAQALVPAHFILLCLIMFIGFVLPTSYMLGWSRWINYLNPMAYSFEALMANEFHDRNFQCSEFIPGNPADHPEWPSDSWVCNAVGAVAGQTEVNGDVYLKLAYGYTNNHKWRDFGICVGFMVVLLAAYMLFAEFNESAKQKGEVLLFQRGTLRKLKKAKAINDIEAGFDRDITEQPDSVDEDDHINVIAAGEDIFHWRDVHYTVKIKSEEREILSGVDGWVKPGTLTALMGASGAGKTTLLDVLANRVTMGVVTGNMFVNGNLRDSSFQRSTGYVQQQDLHLATATVREALRFSAYLRQPASVSKQEKNDYVDEVIKILDMEKYSDAVVGVAGEGLNVEQRKRLTIGVELAAKPKLLLFLDEPTSGLDSQTAWSICQLMRKLANHGQAILCTIHQPSAILLQEFDRLLFLAKGGRTVYFGDLGENCQSLIEYFESHGAPKCPRDANPAEWMLQVIGAAPGSHANQDYHQVWLESEERQDILAQLQDMERELIKLPYDSSLHKDEFAASLWTQFLLVTQRVFQQTWRTPSYLWAKFSLATVASLFIGFVFFNANPTMQGLQNQMFSVFMFLNIFTPMLQQILPSFVAARDLYEMRERPSKTFSWKAFITSQIVSEIPWNALIGTVAYFCWYYPAGFYHNATAGGTTEVNSRGAYAWFFIVLFFVYIGTSAHLVIAPTELADMAGTMAYMMFTFCLVFCGVLVSPSALPGFWIFMYRVSPMTYYVGGFLSNAVAHAEVTCAPDELRVLSPADGMTCGEFFSSYIQSAGTGYVENPSSTSDCQFCPLSNTDDWLATTDLDYSQRWRDLGIFFVYIGFNICGAILFYWWARVPKKSSRVEEKATTNIMPESSTEKLEDSVHSSSS